MLLYAVNTPSFTEDDLEPNRRGLISDPQLEWLKRQQTLLTWVIRFAGAISGVIVVAGIIAGRLANPLFTPAMIVFAAIDFVVIYAFVNRYRRQFDTDIEQGRVERYEGEVRRLSYNKRRGGLTAINIGEYQFYIDRVGFRALPNGEHVRAYVAPVSKALLSFERVDN